MRPSLYAAFLSAILRMEVDYSLYAIICFTSLAYMRFFQYLSFKRVKITTAILIDLTMPKIPDNTKCIFDIKHSKLLIFYH
jgi:hypothetical protein